MKNVELTLEEVSVLFEALAKLSQQELPFDLAWKLDDNIENLAKYAKRFEDARLKILNKYSDGEPTPGEEGKVQYQINDPEKFNIDYSEMASSKIEAKLSLIQVEELKAVKDLKMSGNTLAVLKKYIIALEETADEPEEIKEPQEQ